MNDSEDIKEYLAKIRKTIADSSALIEQANLRIQETDRLLASQGLTREEVLNYKVSPEHRLLVNEELRRRGLPPLEEAEAAFDFNAATERLRQVEVETGVTEDELAARQRKFGTFMQEYRL